MGLLDPTNDCIAYINKLEKFGTNYSATRLVISPGSNGYENTNYVIDDVGYSIYAGGFAGLTNSLSASRVFPNQIEYLFGIDVLSNGVLYPAPHLTNANSVATYICIGAHSALGNEYPRNGTVGWSGLSSWWLIETLESYNGQRGTGQGNFTQWFSDIAFGGMHYENTPVGAVSHVDEPGSEHINDPGVYFCLWASGKNFAICAWRSRRTTYFQAVGDPFVVK
jgi:hypothetical protein